MKISPWFDGSVKPVHVGVYQRMIEDQLLFTHWNGKFWGTSWDTKEKADDVRARGIWQEEKWRGVLK